MTNHRRRRFLDANETTEAPTQHVAIQVEADPVKGGAPGEATLARWAGVCWRFDAGQVSRVCEAENSDPRLWWEWLESLLHPKRRTWIWSKGAHAAFLLLGGWQLVAAKLLAVGFLLDKDPPWVLRFRTSNKPATWVDLRNFTDKGATDHACALDSARATAKIVQEILFWHRASDLGCLGFTAAEMALRAYRHRFAPRVVRGELSDFPPGPEPERKRPICWPVSVECDRVRERFNLPARANDTDAQAPCCPVHEAERQAYYGPLFICHQMGMVRGPIYVVDCQSHYASQMRNKFFPAQYLFSLNRPDLGKALRVIESKATCATVRVCSPDWPYPVRRGGRVGLAVGRFDTTLAGPELHHAHTNGNLECVYDLHAYRPLDLFTPFVEWVWNQRCAQRHLGNEMVASLCKDLLVKLTGKWAQTSDRWEIAKGRRAPRPWGMRLRYNARLRRDVSERFFGDTVQEHAGLHFPAYYFPLVSAYITAYARLHMASVIERVGLENVLYNPVDCLHLTAKGLKRLSDAKLLVEPAMGLFRLEKTLGWANYLGPGAYVRDGEPVVCGLPKHARRVSETRYEYRRVESCAEVFSRPVPGTILTHNGSADLAARHLWGRQRKDGRVFPPVLDDAEDAERFEKDAASEREFMERRL